MLRSSWSLGTRNHLGPPTAESQSRKNHVNNDHFDHSLVSPEISLVPPKCLWSPYNGNLPFFMQVFSLRWSWQLTKQLKDMLYLILKCDLFWWFKFDWVCFGLLGCVWVVLVEVWKVNSGGWVRGGSRCKRRALASHYRQRRTLANSFSQTKV